MEGMRLVLATIMAGSFLVPAGTLRAEVRCEELRLKPISCICGTIIDQVDRVVPGATVTILRDKTKIAAVNTSVDGKFAFHELRAGSYTLKAEAIGFRLFEVPIVVQNPAEKMQTSVGNRPRRRV